MCYADADWAMFCWMVFTFSAIDRVDVVCSVPSASEMSLTFPEAVGTYRATLKWTRTRGLRCCQYNVFNAYSFYSSSSVVSDKEMHQA